MLAKTGAVAIESLPDRRVGAQLEAVHSAPTPRTWAVVLAGGEGSRLKPLVRRLFGDERPKQYVAAARPFLLAAPDARPGGTPGAGRAHAWS